MIIPIEEQLGIVLSSVFGNEIYPIVHPDPDGKISSVSDLYAVYIIVGGSSFNKLQGNTNLSRPRVQISIYGINYNEVKNKTRQLSVAMSNANEIASNAVDNGLNHFEIEGAIANISVSVPVDGREENTKRFFTHSEFYCWNSD